MIIGIHPDRIGQESYSDRWKEFLEERGVEVRWLDLLAENALEQAKACDGVMWRWAHNPSDKQSAQRILYAIEHGLGLPVYPNSATAWHYDEKIAQHYLLQALGAPMPDAWLFWEREKALEWAAAAPYPLVFKLSAGAGSSNVVKLKSRAEAEGLIKKMFRQGIFPLRLGGAVEDGSLLEMAKRFLFRLAHSWRYLWEGEYPLLPYPYWKPEYGYAYFQEFLPGNDFDTRVSVIGERAVGFRRYNREGDFRASGSGRLVFEPQLVDLRCVEIAFDLSGRGGFQSMAYDFLYRGGEPAVSEISYAYADWAVQKCPGHWRRDLSWVEGAMWPEQAQAEDFYRYIQARQRGVG